MVVTRVSNRRLQNLIDSTYVTNYHVTSVGKDKKKNWLVTRNGTGLAGHSYRSKRDAEQAARQLAKDTEGSAVVIFEYASGGVQDWVSY